MLTHSESRQNGDVDEQIDLACGGVEVASNFARP